ncbi:UNVERIFIED_CONTAM: putative mitochondrial protein [Sesamum latifolium]|uniref:Mitochondrial protein n=1 Tax=Sesamum latifolium TaxID=2727402 RepID=A0AAW2YD59_9LAMI
MPESWGSFLRLRVALDVSKPLLRALKIRTVLGDEHLVAFTYERLPNFYYLCGRLGHISKWCESRFQDGFVNPIEESSFEPWLRATSGLASRNRAQQYINGYPQLQDCRPRLTARSTPLGHPYPLIDLERTSGGLALFGRNLSRFNCNPFLVWFEYPLERLQQGNCLSPYLFLLCTESFSSLFHQIESCGVVQGVSVCRGAPTISHLLFVDIMVFCPTNEDTVQHVQGILVAYKYGSGQEINFMKSSVAFSRNTPPDVQRHLVDLLGIRLENKYKKYLGLPAMAFCSKKRCSLCLRIEFREGLLGGTKEHCLKLAKVFLFSRSCRQPIVCNSCFRLPKTLLEEF